MKAKKGASECVNSLSLLRKFKASTLVPNPSVIRQWGLFQSGQNPMETSTICPSPNTFQSNSVAALMQECKTLKAKSKGMFFNIPMSGQNSIKTSTICPNPNALQSNSVVALMQDCETLKPKPKECSSTFQCLAKSHGNIHHFPQSKTPHSNFVAALMQGCKNT